VLEWHLMRWQAWQQVKLPAAYLQWVLILKQVHLHQKQHWAEHVDNEN
jgi:hypothetical protein